MKILSNDILISSPSENLQLSPFHEASRNTIVNVSKPFIPKLLYQRFCQKIWISNKQPEIFSFNGLILFVDVGGFTPLTEKLSKHGKLGAEIIHHILNGYFSELLKIIEEFGGDVMKFAGDALLVAWQEDLEKKRDLKTLCYIGTLCALKLTQFQFNFSNFNYVSREFDLSWIHLHVKVVISMGQLYGCILGGYQDRWEFTIIGKPLVEMSLAEEQADVNNPNRRVIVSNDVWKNIKSYFSGKFLTSSNNTQFYSVFNLLKSNESLNCKNLSSEPIQDSFALREFQLELEIGLQCFLPSSVLKRMKFGLIPSTLADIRYVSTVFIALRQIDIKSPNCFKFLQKGLHAIEEILFYTDGSLRQFIVDDKGAVAVCVFGYPHMSHDNDAVRAVTFALEAKNKFKELSIDFSIGIGTGTAFCATIGSQSRHEYSIVGDIGKVTVFVLKTNLHFPNQVNLSARLMTASSNSPEKLYVDHSTYLAANKSIQFTELGTIRVKGKVHPILIYFPSFRSHHQFTSTPQLSKSISKLHGRAYEKSIILSLIEDIPKFTMPQFILFEAAVGLGKSALLREIGSTCSNPNVFVISSRSIAIRQTPYFLWTPLIRNITNLLPDDSNEEQFQKISNALNNNVQFTKYIPLLNSILLTQLEETEDIKNIQGEMKAYIVEDLLIQIVLNSSKKKPIVFLLDDIHWIDPSSLSFLNSLSTVPNLKALFIMTSRTDYPLKLDIPNLERIVLKPLQDSDLIKCVRDILSHDLSSEAQKLILTKANGNPLFAISFTQLLIERGDIYLRNQIYEIAETYNARERITSKKKLSYEEAIPSTIENLILSRYDILEGKQQYILQIASIIGYKFSTNILLYLIPELEKEMILNYLDILMEKGFLRIIEINRKFEKKYCFEHSLIQEVIYNSIPCSKRVILHCRIAKWYEVKFKVYKKNLQKSFNSVLLAWHFREGKNYAKSMEYFGNGGETAFQHYCPQETVLLLQEALRLSEKVHNPSLLSLVRWNRMIGDSLYFQGKHEEALVYLINVLQLTKIHSENWNNLTKDQIYQNIIIVKKKIIVLMLFPQLRKGKYIEKHLFPFFWEILRACRRLYFVYFKIETDLAILSLLIAFECSLKVVGSGTINELEEHFTYFQISHLTHTIVRRFLNKKIHRMAVEYSKEHSNNEIVQTIFNGCIGFQGMWGNIPNMRWNEIIEIAKKNLEKLYTLVEQSDTWRMTLSIAYFYVCDYQEGEVFSKYIYEEAKKRNHKTHEEIGLRHHSYHLLRQRKTSTVKTISQYIIDNQLVRPNSIDEFDLQVRKVLVLIQEKASLPQIQEEFNKALTYQDSIRFRSFANELICLSCFYDEAFYMFLENQNAKSFCEVTFKLLNSLWLLVQLDLYVATPLIFLIEGDLAYFIERNNQRAFLGWDLSVRRSIELKMIYEETKARLRLGQYLSSSENFEKAKQAISIIGPHWLLETGSIIKNSDYYNFLTNSH